MSRPVVIYRWIVLLLAAGYLLRTFLFSDFSDFGGPYRFLTIWALTLSFLAASRMMALVEDRSTRRWDGFVSMVAVLNTMVVVLYWRLYFADPTSVTRDGQLSAWHLELYLHLVGPLLQVIDAIFLHRAFRRPLAGVAWVLGVLGAYLLWAELLVAPRNDSPVGEVTSGLPYPFLNDLALPERLGFYGTNVAVGLLVLGFYTAICWAVSRASPRREAI